MPTLRILVAGALTLSLLAACSYRERSVAHAPSERARTSTIDDHFTFKWTETGRQVPGWSN